jgi:hypothetical protein
MLGHCFPRFVSVAGKLDDFLRQVTGEGALAKAPQSEKMARAEVFAVEETLVEILEEGRHRAENSC